MKKLLPIIFLSIFFLAPFAAVQAADTNPCISPGSGKGNLGYCPLEPIGGITLTDTASADLPALLKWLFKIIFSVTALLAVVMLVLGGIETMVSSVASVKTRGKERAWAALYGLLILAGSYLILYTINPDLVRLNLFIPGTPSIPAPAVDPTQTGATGSPNDRIPTTACTAQKSDGTVGDYSTSYFIEGAYSSCVKAVNSLLPAGAKLYVGTRSPVVKVFPSATYLQQHQAELQTFQNDCYQDGGQTTTPGNTTAKEPVFACVIRSTGI
jgi:hypothetical protein